MREVQLVSPPCPRAAPGPCFDGRYSEDGQFWSLVVLVLLLGYVRKPRIGVRMASVFPFRICTLQHSEKVLKNGVLLPMNPFVIGCTRSRG